MPLHGFHISTNQEENEAWNKIFTVTKEEPPNCELLHAERITTRASLALEQLANDPLCIHRDHQLDPEHHCVATRNFGVLLL